MTRNGPDLAAALFVGPGIVTDASFTVIPFGYSPAGVAPSYGPNALPRDGDSFAVLSNGTVALPGEPGYPGNRDAFDQGSSARSAFDVTVLRLSIAVPDGVNCLALQFDFFTQDFASPTPNTYADSFVAELDPAAAWSAPPGFTTTAPENFAVDGSGAIVSVASASSPGGIATGYNGVAVATNAQDTGYAGALGWATAFTPVTPGAHTVDLSIFDRGDHLVDSAVLFDNLRTIRRASGRCPRGVVADADLAAPAVTLDAPQASATPTFSGAAGSAPGDETTVRVDVYAKNSVGEAAVQSLNATVSQGAWQTTAAPLAPGDYLVQAQQADAAGNVGVSAPRSFTVPPPPPAPPTPPATTTTTTTAPSTPSPSATLTAAVGKVAGALATVDIATVLEQGGFTAKDVAAPGPGQLGLTLTSAASGGAKPVTLATGSRRVTRAGRYKVKVALTKRGKRVLRRARRVRATVRLRFTPRTGSAITRSARVTLRR